MIHHSYLFLYPPITVVLRVHRGRAIVAARLTCVFEVVLLVVAVAIYALHMPDLKRRLCSGTQNGASKRDLGCCTSSPNPFSTQTDGIV